MSKLFDKLTHFSYIFGFLYSSTALNHSQKTANTSSVSLQCILYIMKVHLNIKHGASTCSCIWSGLQLSSVGTDRVF